MKDLAICPCGKIPTALVIAENGQGRKWMTVSGNCCGLWQIEFRASYAEGEELMKLASEAWQEATRSTSNKSNAAVLVCPVCLSDSDLQGSHKTTLIYCKNCSHYFRKTK